MRKQWNPELAARPRCVPSRPPRPRPGRLGGRRGTASRTWNVGDSASRKGNYTHLDLLLELLLFFYNRTRIQMSLSKLYFYLYRICWVSWWSR